MKKGIKVRPGAKKRSRRISAEARSLILATVRRAGSQRQAAKWLGLKNHMHLVRMLRGEMKETPQMRAAVLRAKDRARRAFLGEKPLPNLLDLEKFRKAVAEVKWTIEVLESYVK